jgi:hypothetical protein
MSLQNNLPKPRLPQQNGPKIRWGQSSVNSKGNAPSASDQPDMRNDGELKKIRVYIAGNPVNWHKDINIPGSLKT